MPWPERAAVVYASSHASLSTFISVLLCGATSLGLVAVCFVACWLQRRSSRNATATTTTDEALGMGGPLALPTSRMQAELLASLPTTLYRRNNIYKKKTTTTTAAAAAEEENKTKISVSAIKENTDAEMGACSYDISSYDDHGDDGNDDDDDGDDDDQCPICLGVFVEGESVTHLPPCGHGFHVQCIHKWLSSHSSCPTCRHIIHMKGKKVTSTFSSSSIILHPSVIPPPSSTMSTGNPWTRFLRIAPIFAILT